MSKTAVVEAAPGCVVRFPTATAISQKNRGLVLVGEGAYAPDPVEREAALKARRIPDPNKLVRLEKSAPTEVEVDQFVRGRLRAGDLVRVLDPASKSVASSAKNTTSGK